MSFITNETNAQFYQMVHQLIKSQNQSERRVHQRDSFTSTQLIAPLRDGQPPQSEDFFEVRCHDLTPGGFSFFTSEKPDFEQFVVAFGTASKKILIQAEVRHSRKVLWFADSGRVEILDDAAVCSEYYESEQNPSVHERGEPAVLVGCRFTGRFN